MAALIKDSLQLDADLEPGGRGEFTIWEKTVIETVSKAVGTQGLP